MMNRSRASLVALLALIAISCNRPATADGAAEAAGAVDDAEQSEQTALNLLSPADLVLLPQGNYPDAYVQVGDPNIRRFTAAGNLPLDLYLTRQPFEESRLLHERAHFNLGLMFLRAADAQLGSDSRWRINVGMGTFPIGGCPEAKRLMDAGRLEAEGDAFAERTYARLQSIFRASPDTATVFMEESIRFLDRDANTITLTNASDASEDPTAAFGGYWTVAPGYILRRLGDGSATRGFVVRFPTIACGFYNEANRETNFVSAPITNGDSIMWFAFDQPLNRVYPASRIPADLEVGQNVHVIVDVRIGTNVTFEPEYQGFDVADVPTQVLRYRVQTLDGAVLAQGSR